MVDDQVQEDAVRPAPDEATIAYRQRLVTGCLHLVRGMAALWHRRRPDLDFDDLESAGRLGLCEAARLYECDGHNEASFATFARFRVQWRMSEVGRLLPLVRVPRNSRKSEQARAYVRAEASVDDYCTLPTGGVTIEMIEAAQAAIDACTPLQRRAWALCRGVELSPAGRAYGIRGAAELLGISKTEVRTALKEACAVVERVVRSHGWDRETWNEALAE